MKIEAGALLQSLLAIFMFVCVCFSFYTVIVGLVQAGKLLHTN